jgi:hypothetical protein
MAELALLKRIATAEARTRRVRHAEEQALDAQRPDGV